VTHAAKNSNRFALSNSENGNDSANAVLLIPVTFYVIERIFSGRIKTPAAPRVSATPHG
jgi:hypothetical protein